jgi:hypothetical protein
MGALSMVWRVAAVPVAGWHDLHHLAGHHPSGGPVDPAVDAGMTALLVGVGVGVFVSLISGGLLMVFARRARTMLWAIPLANLVPYAVYLLSRRYPGGRAAQFQGEALVYVLVGTGLLLILSLIVAVILLLIRLLARVARSAGASRHELHAAGQSQDVRR